MTYERTNNVLLTIDHVHMQYGDRQILRDVHMQITDVVRPGVTQGQVVGLLGPSGVGKTQLFRILAGLQEATSGRVLLGNEGKPVKTGQVGVVAQHYPLFRHRTVLDNLVVAGKQAGMDSKTAREKSLALLATFGLESHKNMFPIQLSGGQRQRVAIAQQLICSDNFLLMDEPFSGLDVISKDTVFQLINQVAQMNELNTLIITTHEVRAAVMVADSLWMLGYEKNAAGEFLPGARVVKAYDLAAMGMAWNPDIRHHPQFNPLVDQIEAEFKNLK